MQENPVGCQEGFSSEIVRCLMWEMFAAARKAGPPKSPGFYMGTSLIRNRTPLGPYSRTLPRALSVVVLGEGGCFLRARDPCSGEMPLGMTFLASFRHAPQYYHSSLLSSFPPGLLPSFQFPFRDSLPLVWIRFTTLKWAPHLFNSSFPSCETAPPPPVNEAPFFPCCHPFRDGSGWSRTICI